MRSIFVRKESEPEGEERREEVSRENIEKLGANRKKYFGKDKG